MITTALELVPSPCAVCRTYGNADEVYPARSLPETLDPTLFSARRPPDGVHFRMVRCRSCGLLRSDPLAHSDVLAALYGESTFDEAEVPNLRRTYGHYLAELERYGVRKDDLLEIGCGTGYFLEESLAHGYERAVGVEPSRAASRRKPEDPRIEIVRDVMRDGLFRPGTFDVVCIFQTLDHLPDPAAVLDQCSVVLRDGGLLLALNHDVSAMPARLLGERSPIIDIEHTYLYDTATMRRIAADRGFDVLDVRPARNAISLRYLAHLVPLPPIVRDRLVRWLGHVPAGGIRLWLPLGNLVLIARKRVAT